jgi:thiol-disulfide isomerase/thioredoxin
MRKILTIVSVAALAAALFAQAPSAPKATEKKTSEAPLTPRRAGEFVIHMPDGKDNLLSSYRGKLVVLAFMHTTCPHCQHIAGILSKIQKDYAAKGVQILGVAFDKDAKRDVANFDKLYATGFPCGYAAEDQVLKFVHSPPGYFIPMLLFIDRTGIVRSQYLPNGDPNSVADKFFNDQDASVRKEVDKYLKASAATAKKTSAQP